MAGGSIYLYCDPKLINFENKIMKQTNIIVKLKLINNNIVILLFQVKSPEKLTPPPSLQNYFK
jgi:hypothetical protein